MMTVVPTFVPTLLPVVPIPIVLRLILAELAVLYPSAMAIPALPLPMPVVKPTLAPSSVIAVALLQRRLTLPVMAVPVLLLPTPAARLIQAQSNATAPAQLQHRLIHRIMAARVL